MNHEERINLVIKLNLNKVKFYDNSNAYILVSGTITITGVKADDNARLLDERNKAVTFKNCAPFTECISNINNTQIDNANDIDVVIPQYDLIEYRDKYSKISESLWQYDRDDPNDNITQSESFKSNIKITEQIPGNSNTKNVEMVLPLLEDSWNVIN